VYVEINVVLSVNSSVDVSRLFLSRLLNTDTGEAQNNVWGLRLSGPVPRTSKTLVDPSDA
jgi:hypothetical protein